MHPQIDGLRAIVTVLKEQKDEFKEQNDEFRGQIRELGKRIGKSSRNSSRAPSSDSASQRANRPKKPRTTRLVREHSRDILATNGHGTYEKIHGELKSSFTFAVVPTQSFHANSAWKLLNLMAININRTMQAAANCVKRQRTQKR